MKMLFVLVDEICVFVRFGMIYIVGDKRYKTILILKGSFVGLAYIKNYL